MTIPYDCIQKLYDSFKKKKKNKNKGVAFTLLL